MRETFGFTYFKSLKRDRKCTGAGRIQRKAHLKRARETSERDTMIIRGFCWLIGTEGHTLEHSNQTLEETGRMARNAGNKGEMRE